MLRLRVIIFAVGVVVVVTLGYFAWPFFDYFVVVRVRGAVRLHESLPSVSIESDRLVYCRMQYCDFRFPLPHGAQVVQTDSVSGGFDTIKGAIYVRGHDGGPIDLQAYAGLLQQHNFNVQPGFTSEADPPWVGAPVKHDHLKDYTIPFAASTKDGGWVAVDIIDGSTKIAFSYFGDY
jgi:hypothetical protein